MTDMKACPATDASLLADNRVKSTYRTVNGVRLHVVTAGDPDAPLVVLLHGFPDFWYGWHDQISSLVEAGFRVIVPDQRGCNLSDAPKGEDAYRQSILSADIQGLIDSEDRKSAHVVGHDFGAFVAWDLALRRPSVVDRLGIVNVPHPTVYRNTLRSNPRQLLRSWYALFYQLPKLPEWALGRNDAAGLVWLLNGSSNDGTFDTETINRYRAAWHHNGVGPMVNWYRGILRSNTPPHDTVTQPTLICWGEDDVALEPSMAQDSINYCEDGRLKLFPNVSHWVHQERAEVTEALLDHLRE